MDKNSIYWAYNLPLQIWPEYEDEENESGKILGYRVLNYMPRKEAVSSLELCDLLGDQTKEEFFESAALHLENLAKQFRQLKNKDTKFIYYPDEGMDK